MAASTPNIPLIVPLYGTTTPVSEPDKADMAKAANFFRMEGLLMQSRMSEPRPQGIYVT